MSNKTAPLRKSPRSRIMNAIENAGSWLNAMDGESQLSDRDLDAHHEVGRLLIEKAELVMKTLYPPENNKPLKQSQQ